MLNICALSTCDVPVQWQNQLHVWGTELEGSGVIHRRCFTYY